MVPGDKLTTGDDGVQRVTTGDDGVKVQQTFFYVIYPATPGIPASIINMMSTALDNAGILPAEAPLSRTGG